MPVLRAATRGSPLARLQTDLVAELLGPDVTVEFVVVETTGDRRSDVPIAQVLSPDIVLPQVAQGALAVECRADDDETIELLRSIEHPPSRRAVDAERAFLASIGGGCDLPVGAHATVADDDTISLEGLIA